ncbi:MAG: SCP2 sterol-binding domain-containing protein [Nitrososphaerota archaeon]|jgi:putative sterol carrier protein|uniref:SCP2 sterol-binding domain-containing protein n=1 Tax=Candidatus Bathycorpusculum sp. TaxID=2994959 RepID=UPI00282DDD84|nr:SCP2 sterol-binding domain-containing protein [Candidatus Termitimicrobium sp.]MCL2431129.1 SCP2 sterol-binding domain-containing protein [Candidatus Termitimicrobium sp.]MDR0492926.1 SCP2 sterol-binding domain-containing protein [Nitrososphaerota archaeon]
MDVQTPREFFEKRLPEKFKPEKAAGIDIVTQFDVSGPDGGNWSITVKNQKLQVTEGTALSPNLELKMSGTDFLDIVNGKLSAEKAVLSGKIQFQGNISVALKLRDAGFL